MATKISGAKTTFGKLRPVIVRTCSAGVHFGYLAERRGTEVELRNARRIWSWQGANTLNEIANHGVKQGSKISEAVISILLTEAIEIIECATEGERSLNDANWN